MKTLLISMMICFNTFASIPSVEGLFRHSSNPDIEGDLVSLRFVLEEVSDEGLLEKSVKDASAKEEGDIYKSKVNVKFIKLIFALQNNEIVDLLQVEYSAPSMKPEEAIRSTLIPGLTSKIAKLDSPQKSIFYSTMMMLGINSSKGMAEILKRYANDFKKNKELMDKEVVQLYDDFKKYLLITKEDKVLKEEMESPLKPKDPEMRKKVQELLKRPMYIKSGKVKFAIKSNERFWHANFEGVSAFFTNEKHQIRSLDVSMETGLFKATFDDFVLFDGKHSLPKQIIIKTIANKDYRIRFIDLDDIKNNGKNIFQRSEDYLDLVSKNIKDLEVKRLDDPLTF